MENLDLTQRAIAVAQVLLGRELLIKTTADFTPPGRRTARVVQHAKNGRRTGAHLRWYVGGRTFRSLPLTTDSVALTNAWKASAQVSGQLVLL